ncbi:MAG: hypothetical protein ACE361_13195 [Aureliella sp.]
MRNPWVYVIELTRNDSVHWTRSSRGGMLTIGGWCNWRVETRREVHSIEEILMETGFGNAAEEAITAGTRSASSFSRYLPYAMSLVGLLVGYLATRAFGLGTLAVAMAVVGAVSGYILCRVFQSRGKVSLTVTAIVFPLLAAVVCVAFLKLAPFRDRNQGIIALQSEKLKLTLRPPGRQKEWLIDRSGNMLPIWLASMIGPACLSELRGIEGDLTGLQNVDLSLLEPESVTWVRLGRLEPGGPPVSSELIGWLNECQAIPRRSMTQFTLVDYQAEDGLALANLNHRLMLTLQNCEQLPDLAELDGAEFLYLSGERLAAERARQLQHVDGLRFLRLNLSELGLETIEALSGLPKECYLTIEQAELNSESLEGLAALGVFGVELRGCQFRQIPRLPAAALLRNVASRPQVSGAPYLRLVSSQISYEECQLMASHFRCETLSLMDVRVSNFGPSESGFQAVENPFFDLESPEVEFFWELRHLQKIECNSGGWRTLDRPAD